MAGDEGVALLNIKLLRSSQESKFGYASGRAGLDNGWAELFDFFQTDALDGLELVERLRTREDDAAQRGGGEDEELGEA